MTRNTAVTVRLPGASSAPTTTTCACSHTRLENKGANLTISRVRATGTVSMPHLFWHKSGDQLTNLSLCFQSPLQMDKVELRRCCTNSHDFPRLINQRHEDGNAISHPQLARV